MARKTALFTGETIVARSAASIIAADSATLTDVNIPVAQAINCSGFDTILVGVEITVPGTATMVIEALFRDEEPATGLRWSRLLLGAAPGVTVGALASEKTPALVNLIQYAELRVFGHPAVFLRIDAVANEGGTTAWKILVRPGQVRGDRSFNR